MDELTSEDLRILRQQLEQKNRELAEKEMRLKHKEDLLDEEKRIVEKQMDAMQASIDQPDLGKGEHDQDDRLKHLLDIINEQQNINKSMQANLDKVMGEMQNFKNDRPSSQAAMFTADVWGEPSGYNPHASTPREANNRQRAGNPNGQNPINPQTQHSVNLPSIKYKDALESVPTFTGYNIPVLRFIRACQKVRNLFDSNHEQNLLLLLKNKLRGNAQTALEDDNSNSIKEFIDQLKLLFGSSKSVNEYRGELGSTIKQPTENAIQYISRVKDLHFAIIEMDEEIWGKLTPAHRAQCEYDTMDSFVKGLPPDFRIRVRQRPFNNLDELFAQTIGIEKEIATDQRFSKLAGPPLPPRNIRAAFASKPPCDHCNKPGHDSENCWTAFPEKRPNRNEYRGPNNYNRPGGNFNRDYNNSNRNNNNFNRDNGRPRPHCTYCDKLGHIEERCYQKRDDESKNANSRPTEQGPSGEQRSRPVQPIKSSPSAPSTSA